MDGIASTILDYDNFKKLCKITIKKRAKLNFKVANKLHFFLTTKNIVKNYEKWGKQFKKVFFLIFENP